MIYAEFECANSEFRIMKPWATFANTFTAAHDLIEHNPETDSGTIEEEFMALGAGLILRELIVSHLSPGYLIDAVRNDISHVTSQYCDGNVKPVHPSMKGHLPALYHERLRECILNFGETTNNKVTQKTLQNIFDWVHVGACKAYEKHSHRLETVQNLFYTLRNIFKHYMYKFPSKAYLRIVFDWTGSVDYELIHDNS